MDDNKLINMLNELNEALNENFPRADEYSEAIQLAEQAVKMLQQYKAIGTVEECRLAGKKYDYGMKDSEQKLSLGKKIRRLRVNNCLSQARLAEAIDVSTNYIGQIERGDRTPSLDTLMALCNALHTSIDYVVSDDVSTRNDEIITDIRAQLVKLTPDEKQYFYHMLVGYIQLKEENDKAQKNEILNQLEPYKEEMTQLGCAGIFSDMLEVVRNIETEDC